VKDNKHYAIICYRTLNDATNPGPKCRWTKKAIGQKGRGTKRPGDGKAWLFDAPKTRTLDWADSNVECLLVFVM